MQEQFIHMTCIAETHIQVLLTLILFSLPKLIEADCRAGQPAAPHKARRRDDSFSSNDDSTSRTDGYGRPQADSPGISSPMHSHPEEAALVGASAQCYYPRPAWQLDSNADQRMHCRMPACTPSCIIWRKNAQYSFLLRSFKSDVGGRSHASAFTI